MSRVERTLRRWAKPAMAALTVAFLMLASAPASAETPVERHGRLSVQGNRIVDQHGAPVSLHGMSLFWSQWQPQYYNRDAIQWLADDWNVSVIRAAIAVHAGGYMEHPQVEMARAEAAIEAAVAAGIYVIIDWHAHDPEPEAASRFFASIASRYGDLPNLIYETWNEPLPQYDWTTSVRPYHEAVIGVIRARDPDNLVIAGTPSWSQDVDIAAETPLTFDNVAYTLHFYAGTHRGDLRAKAETALSKGVAIFVTEWGTTNADGDGGVDAAETELWWRFIADNQLSDLNWSVADKDEASAALLPGASGRGGWRMDEISPSGRLVRERLRTLER